MFGWQDAEGDAAHRAFEITLHRLRRLMRSEKAVKRQGGQVSLDKRHCWVDIWVFDHVVERIQDTQERNSETGRKKSIDVPGVNPFNASMLSVTQAQSETIRLTGKAISMYKGLFLPSDTHCAWTASARERLRDKFRHLVILLGDHLEQARQRENAAVHYQQAIEKDGLAEAFYQRLMICSQHLGQGAQCIEVYQRLKNALSAAFGIEPSPLTESPYKTLRCKYA